MAWEEAVIGSLRAGVLSQREWGTCILCSAMREPSGPQSQALAERYFDRARARPRRHGDGLPRRGAEARPPGRDQGAARRSSPRRVGAERFLREIGIAARLSHPHIVPLIDSGDADGRLYYVSPYVPGGSLRDRLEREQQLPCGTRCASRSEVGDGARLRAPQRLRPSRREAGEHSLRRRPRPARRLRRRARRRSADARRSGHRGGLALGTPEYMSPEQASGERDIGAPSDVYSLACVVYEMLAGEPPFRGGDARGDDGEAGDGDAAAAARRCAPRCPRRSSDALARALAKDPAQRFATRGGVRRRAARRSRTEPRSPLPRRRAASPCCRS